MKALILIAALLLAGCQEPVPDTRDTNNNTINTTNNVNSSTPHPNLQPSAAAGVQSQ